MRLPVEVSEGESRDEAGGGKLVDVVRVEALDYNAQRLASTQDPQFSGENYLPVTLEVENCSMIAS